MGNNVIHSRGKDRKDGNRDENPPASHKCYPMAGKLASRNSSHCRSGKEHDKGLLPQFRLIYLG
jgi:hypothetical protein